MRLFGGAHHEAWLQSEFNQREYCEAYGVPLKAFGNWRAKLSHVAVLTAANPGVLIDLDDASLSAQGM